MLSEPGCGICQRWEGISPLLWLVSGRENLPGQFRETSPSQNSRVSSFGMLLNSTYLLLLALWQSWVLRLSPFLPFVKVTRLWFQKLINSSSYFPVHWRSYQTVALSVFPTCWGQKVTLGTSRHHFPLLSLLFSQFYSWDWLQLPQEHHMAFCLQIYL